MMTFDENGKEAHGNFDGRVIRMENMDDRNKTIHSKPFDG